MVPLIRDKPVLVMDVVVELSVQVTISVPPLDVPMAYSYLAIPETDSVKETQLPDSVESVSYTHLTLPTICSV